MDRDLINEGLRDAGARLALRRDLRRQGQSRERMGREFVVEVGSREIRDRRTRTVLLHMTRGQDAEDAWGNPTLGAPVRAPGRRRTASGDGCCSVSGNLAAIRPDFGQWVRLLCRILGGVGNAVQNIWRDVWVGSGVEAKRM